MKVIAICVLSAVFCCVTAGQAPPPPPQPQPPAANPADVKSIDSIVKAVYDVISGAAGQKRDWQRFQSLFLPGARMVPLAAKPGDGYAARVLTPEDYPKRAEPFFEKEGFYESEVARRTEQWAHIAQVFSTYEARHAPGEKPFLRGINSIQLMNDGQRWWVVSIMWQPEDAANPLPEKK